LSLAIRFFNNMPSKKVLEEKEREIDRLGKGS